MKTFQYRHEPTLSQEFVNGAYELGEVQRMRIDGHEIIYRLGSALLDNSCCGSYGCGYALVIGEAISSKQEGDMTVSTVRQISADDAIAENLRETLMKQEALGMVNFYVSAQAGEVSE